MRDYGLGLSDDIDTVNALCRESSLSGDILNCGQKRARKRFSWVCVCLCVSSRVGASCVGRALVCRVVTPPARYVYIYVSQLRASKRVRKRFGAATKQFRHVAVQLARANVRVHPSQ